MNTAHHPDGAGRRLPVWVLAPVALLSLGLAGVYAFCLTFTKFAPYDDEGYLMMTVRGFLEGHPLYQDVFTPYGPFYYFYQWLLHGLASVPLTHDATRLLCVLHWLGSAAILALAGGVMTRSFTMTLFIFLQGVAHLSPLTNEPGHPQELVSVLLALAVLAAATARGRSWMAPLLGVFAAALVFTKINAGVFFGFALALALLGQTPFLQRRRAWFYGLLAVSGLVPVLLMRQHLAEGWARAYALQSGAAILSAGAAAFAFPEKCRLGKRPLISAGLGFSGASALLLSLALLTGTSLAGLLDGLILTPSRLAGVSYLPLRTPYGSWSGIAAVLAVALAVILPGWLAKLRFLIIGAKGLYGLAGALVLVTHPRAQFACLLPWGWLLLVPMGPGASGQGRDTLARSWVCLLAAWQSLQAYPVAGTQICLATSLSVLIYSLCLHDAITALAAAAQGQRPREAQPERGVNRSLAWPGAVFSRAFVTRTAAGLQGLVLVLLLGLFAFHWCNLRRTCRVYVELKPLGLPGSHRLRLPSDEVHLYRELAQYLAPACDTFLTYPGLNSLYFWTGKPPPTYLSLNGETLPLSEGQQERVVRALQSAKRPLVVVNEAQAEGSGAYAPSRQGPLLHFLRDECQEVKRLGPFRILTPSKTQR